LFHADLAEWMLSALDKSDLSADVYISTDTQEKADTILGVFSRWGKGSVAVRVVENRGRDIAPKLVTFADVYARYDLVLLLHSKKSSHYDFGEAWRDYLVQSLAGSSAIVNSIMAIFDTCPSVGMVIPQHYSELRAVCRLDWGWNFRAAKHLASRMNIDVSADGYVDMPSGSMLWARPQALKPFLDLHLSFDDFPAEPLPDDGTIAHCIERLFLFACEKAGYTWLKVSHQPDAASIRIQQAMDIERFVAQHRFDLLRPSAIQ
jgi:lipopolysaccharide biosynthesis protein